MKHELKIKEKYFLCLASGKKSFEVRLNDRDFQAGDQIEFTVLGDDGLPDSTYCPRLMGITYVHSGLGMAEGYVVLGVEWCE
jgi:hypothetical protein